MGAKLLIGVLWIWTSIPLAFAGETLRIVMGNWPPYISSNHKNYGVLPDIVSEAFASEGVQVEYKIYPWARAYNGARSGSFDGSIIWFKKPEREKDFVFSEPVLITKQALFHLKSYTFDWKTLDDLKTIRLGALNALFVTKEFESMEKSQELSIKRSPYFGMIFRQLLAGRIQVLINDLETGYGIVGQEFPPGEASLITHHPQFIKESPQHLMLSKKYAKRDIMLKRFNRGLKKLRESGKYEQMFAASRRGKYLKK